MKSVYILMHQRKPNTPDLVMQLSDCFCRHGISVVSEAWLYDLASKLGISGFQSGSPDGCDAVVAVGGDGTLLRANAVAIAHHLPVLGVNIGRVGFLTEIELEQLDETCEKLASDDFSIESRMMLAASIDGGEPKLALNDVVISRGGYARLIGIDTWVDDDPIGRFLADGLIVSTSTGSTGYSLSAGGPIVCPEVECMVLTPICAHSLQHRPVVTASSQKVSIRLTDAVKAMISIDGQDAFDFAYGQELTITKSPQAARFIRMAPNRFFSKIRIKLSEWSAE